MTPPRVPIPAAPIAGTTDTDPALDPALGSDNGSWPHSRADRMIPFLARQDYRHHSELNPDIAAPMTFFGDGGRNSQIKARDDGLSLPTATTC